MTDKQWLDKYFWPKVVKDTNCWFWVGAKSRGGYGNISFKNQRTFAAHRIIKSLTDGLDPLKVSTKMLACHTCDNKLCVNPKHLYWGTHKDNALDASKSKKLYFQKIGHGFRGETNGRAKITAKDALDIIFARKNGLKIKTLMEKYKLSDSSIYDITTGKKWSHVTGIKYEVR